MNYLSHKSGRKCINPTIIVQPKIVVSQKTADKTITSVYDIDKWFQEEYNKLLVWNNNDKRLGNVLFHALEDGDMVKAVDLFNIALATIPNDNPRGGDSWRNEYWYRSMFMMLLRGAEIISYAEVHVQGGRSDLVIQFYNIIIVIEFKVTYNRVTTQTATKTAIKQIYDNGYAKGYNSGSRRVICAVIVADNPTGPVKVEVSK